jgi:hypothetical protein
MEQNPWETDTVRVVNKFPLFLWNLKVRYHVDNGASRIRILCHLNAVHIIKPYFFKIN